MKLSFIWWNTSLSPLGKDRASEEQKQLAFSMIGYFTHDLDADLIALGEVSDLDITAIRKHCNLSGYEIFDGYKRAGKAYFDTCVIFKSKKFSLINDTNITAKKGGNTFKIAQRLDLTIVDHEIPLHLFVSHWPSRLRMQENHPDRTFIAHKLRSSIEELMELYKEEATLVLLGDYNDEPFNESLSQHLMATRDRALVKAKPYLLYNPFWRKLGHEIPYFYNSGESNVSAAGTHYYKGGRDSRWSTFDQIIFSSNFLGDSTWHLNEKFTQILNMDSYTQQVLNPKQIFDHFPVISVVEKVA